jgi:hypothetical protein
MYQNVVVVQDRSVLNRIEEQLKKMDFDFICEKMVAGEDLNSSIYFVQFSVFSNDTRRVRRFDTELTKMFRSFIGFGSIMSYSLDKTSEPNTLDGCRRAIKQYYNDLDICWTTKAI